LSKAAFGQAGTGDPPGCQGRGEAGVYDFRVGRINLSERAGQGIEPGVVEWAAAG
jgi:hypothetical protein